ncbi:MAG: hypothetical protein GXO28_01930 [Methanopyri archaeon]|nr:hypothetical protein [Methanopyri archaeon]
MIGLALLTALMVAAQQPSGWVDHVVEEALEVLGHGGVVDLPEPCPLSDVVEAMREHGVYVIPVAVGSHGLPKGSIVLVSGPPLGPRYAVIVERFGDRLLLYDPARGVVEMGIRRFDGEYLGIAIVPGVKPPGATVLPGELARSMSAW